MLPSRDIQNVVLQAQARTPSDKPLGERLVSMVFAPPSSRIYKELGDSLPYLNSRSGSAWDLFFVGMKELPIEKLSKPGRRELRIEQNYYLQMYEQFDEEAFTHAVRQVESAHAHALARTNVRSQPRWVYSGRATLVSVMCYSGGIDWLSLRAVDLQSLGDTPIAEVTEKLTPWATGEIDRLLSPGMAPPGVEGPRALAGALAYSAAITLAGALATDATEHIINRFLLRG